MIKPGRTRWEGHVARMGGKNACRILVGKPERMKPLGKPTTSIWENNIKMYLK
jgi:hypothetical protein